MTLLRALVWLSPLLVACAGASRAPSVPVGATALDAARHDACACVLLHVTTSASPSRAIDRAALREAAATEPTLCAYEVLADDPAVLHAQSTELAPYLREAEGTPVDLVFRPGDEMLVRLGDADVHAACGGPHS